jgi:hypothetical protein
MEAIFALVAAIVALVGLDLASMGSGADSRPGIADDHQR